MSELQRPVRLDMTISSQMIVRVFEGETCATGTRLVGSTDMEGPAGTTFVPFIEFLAEANQPYLITAARRNPSAIDSATIFPTCGCTGPITRLSCGGTLSGDTDAFVRRSWIPSHECGTPVASAGPERHHEIVATTPTLFRVTLTPRDADLDLFVDQGSTCSSTFACSTKSGLEPETITFSSAEFGNFGEYRIAVDSNGVGGRYDLSLECAPGCRETRAQLQCGYPTTGILVAQPSHVNSWGTCMPDAAGNEAVLAFVAPASGTFTARVHSPTLALAMVVVAGNPGFANLCDPTQPCLARSAEPTANEQNVQSVTFTAEAGRRYYLALEAVELSGGGEYTVELDGDCP